MRKARRHDGVLHLTVLVMGILCLAVADGAASELDSLVLDGHELHDSLVTRDLDEIRHVPGSVVGENPCLSAEPEFVEAIGRSSSQGQLNGKGVRRALYAYYSAERDLGLYGLEAASVADADRLEEFLRGVWARNASLDRARVHRENLVLVVAWHDGVSPECWEAVNAGIAARLVAR